MENSRKKIVLVLTTFVFIGLLGFGQRSKSFSTIEYNTSNGFNASDAYGISQDLHGFIWIGSNQGLYRFDGNAFKLYAQKDGIESRVIARVYCLEDSSIIVIGQQPYKVYRIINNSISSITNSEDYRLIGHYTTANQYEVFGLSYRKRSVIRINRDTFEYHPFPNKFRPVNPHSNERGKFIISHSRNGGLRSWTKEKITDITPVNFNHAVGFVSFDSDQKLWAFSKDITFNDGINGTYQIEQLNDSLFSPPSVTHAVWAADKRLWMADRHIGLNVFDPSKKQVENVDHLLNLENVQVSYLFKDKDNNLWISTIGKGVICVLQNAFTNFTVHDGLTGNYITSLQTDDSQNLWVGTNMGLNLLSLSSNDSNQIDITRYESTGYITDISLAPDGQILCAGSDNNSTYSYVDFGPCAVANNFASVLQTSSGLALSDWQKLHYFERHKIGANLDRSNSSKAFLFGDRLQEHILHRGSEYILTATQLYQVVTDSLVKMDIPVNPGHPFREYFHCLHFDRQNNMWIGSSQGISVKIQSKWKHYDVSNGLTSNLCKAIATDNDGRAWIGTDKGLNCIDGEKVLTFTTGSGLPSNSIQALAFDSLSNKLWVGTTDGLSLLSIDVLNEHSSTPSFSLLISALEVIGDTIIETPNKATLERLQNHIRIHFSTINYVRPDETVFQFKMRGTDSKWIETKAHHAEFLALEPGDYTFMVRSKVSGSVWGDISELHFTIKRAFWQHWFFWVSLACMASMVTYLIVRRIIRNIKKEEMQKRRTLSTINRLEQQALQATLNPHFIFNSLNSIQGFLGEHMDTHAVNFVSEFSRLIRQSMESTMRKHISLEDELDRLQRYLKLEAIRLENRLTYDINIAPKVPIHELEVPTMLIQPFVENAIWHGIAPCSAPGHVEISIDLIEDVMHIEITDNGVGLNHGKKGKTDHISRGITLTRNRLHTLSERNQLKMEELTDNSTVLGTRVTILLDMG